MVLNGLDMAKMTGNTIRAIGARTSLAEGRRGIVSSG